MKGPDMAKKEAAKKAVMANSPPPKPGPQTVQVFVPDSIFNLGPDVQEMIGRVTFQCTGAGGVTLVRVNPNSDYPT
jgi:hypothetical protein